MFRVISMIIKLVIHAIKVYNKSLRHMNKFILTLFLINVALSQSPHGEINIQCSSCHSTSGWKPIKEKIDFDHSTTGFQLVDSHAKIKCTDCHKKR
jgi:hypothetical protein